jgi:hypothetical protein
MTRPAPLRDLEPSQLLLVDDHVQGDDPSVDEHETSLRLEVLGRRGVAS